MNENKRIDNPWIGALKKKTGVESTKKNGSNFQYTKFSVTELVLTDRRNPSGISL